MKFKELTGQYGGNSGICLFEDGKFLLYGYATAVFGDYKINEGTLLFYPDKMEMFEVYGHHNKNLAKGMRANFKGFERGSATFIELNGLGMQRVFNEDANCFDGPFVYENSSVPKQIGLSAFASSPSGMANKSEYWNFDNKEGYNDFILVHNEAKKEYEDFRGRIVSAEGKKVLQLSNYGGEKGYRLNSGHDEAWTEMLEWKKEYERSASTDLNTAYANQHYRVFSADVLSNYQLNANKNVYIKNAGNNNDEEYFSDNEYQDDRVLRKYLKLQPSKKADNAGLSDKVLSGSVFFSVCGEGAEKSYHYKGLKSTTPAGKTTKLDTIAPTIVPPPAGQR